MSAKVARLPLPVRPVPENPRATVSDTKLTRMAYKKILNAIVYGKFDTAIYRNRVFDAHNKILELVTARSVSKACDTLDDHISRTKHFHARVNWSAGRSHRKDYKLRDYSAIFAD